MKKTVLFLAIALLSLIAFSGINAQNYIKIYKSDICLTMNVNEVDSIVFSNDGSTPDSHRSVDLGLPSGTKWADRNVGSSSPDDYGSYFAWGETETKDVYNWSTYKWCNGTDSVMTKYVTDSSFGQVDGLSVLTPENDVATVKWGDKWRMPTQDEMDELLSKCSWTLITSDKGVTGYKVTGPNGNSIFLPLCGFKDGGTVAMAEKYGQYWSSTLRPKFNNNAISLDLVSTNHDWMYHVRSEGSSVRPVMK